MPDHDIHTDLGAYVAGGLELDETERFERHLDECSACRAQASGLAEVASLLERAPPVHVLPNGLRERTFAAVRDAAAAGHSAGSLTAQEPGATGSSNANGDGGWAGGGRAGGAVRLPRARRRSWLRRPAFALAAACALGVAVFAGTRLGADDPAAPVASGSGGAPELEASSSLPATRTLSPPPRSRRPASGA